jgi:hypothetical protein
LFSFYTGAALTVMIDVETVELVESATHGPATSADLALRAD